MEVLLAIAIFAVGVVAVFAGAELFAEHLGGAAAGLGVSAFALGLLLAGAEPEELATVVTAAARDAPGIAFGDVVGANVALSLVALGAAAVRTPIVIGARVRLYAYGAVPLGVVAVLLAWDAHVGRIEGGILVVLYGVYVAVVWARERHPPALGEIAEIAEAEERGATVRPYRELALSIAGVALLAAGSVGIVEAVKSLTDVEETQTALGVTLVGFATAFELVVLAWSATRRGEPETALAGIVGSFAYNATMTLGAGALVRPLTLVDAGPLRLPLALMPVALALPLLLARHDGRLDRPRGGLLLAAYVLFVAASLNFA